MQGARGRRLTSSATIIQAAFRGMHARRDFRQKRLAVLRIQAAFRGMRTRRLAQQLRRERAASRIAAAWRIYKARK